MDIDIVKGMSSTKYILTSPNILVYATKLVSVMEKLEAAFCAKEYVVNDCGIINIFCRIWDSHEKALIREEATKRIGEIATLTMGKDPTAVSLFTKWLSRTKPTPQGGSSSQGKSMYVKRLRCFLQCILILSRE